MFCCPYLQYIYCEALKKYHRVPEALAAKVRLIVELYPSLLVVCGI